MGIKKEYRFDSNYQHHILSVIFDSDSFFYAVHSVDGNLKAAVEYSLQEADKYAEVSDIIRKEGLEAIYYSMVSVFSRSNRFAFIPSEVFQEERLAGIVKNSFDASISEVSCHNMENEKLHIIHADDDSIIHALRPILPEGRVNHISAVYLESLREDGLYVSILNHKTVLYLRNKGRFLFYNQFDTETIVEQLYFIMLVLDQFSLDARDFSLHVMGQSDSVDQLLPLLSQYCGNVNNTHRNFPELKDSNDFIELYLSSLCE